MNRFSGVRRNAAKSRKIRLGLWLPALCVLLWTAGCATARTAPDETGAVAAHTGPWTLTELTDELGGPDPIEGFNRAMFSVTDFVMVWIADPVGRVYTTILPRPVIEHFDNVCKNLEFPAHAFSSLGRAEWKGAWDETARFLLNTTVGIAGIFDPAAHWFDIYPTDSDFGLMFCDWGIGPGCTFMLPLVPTVNVRDTVGYLFDTAFDLKTYIPYAGYATALNRMTIAERDYSKLRAGSSDPYKSYREMMLARRELQRRMWFYRAKNAAAEQRRKLEKEPVPVEEPHVDAPTPRPAWVTAGWKQIPGYRPQSPVLDTMRVARFNAQNDDDPWYMRLSFLNGDFSRQCEDGELELAPDTPPLHYGFWAAPEPEKDQKGEPVPLPEKLAILIPGIGGNYFGMTSTALAELLHLHGYAVLSLDSPFAWQFMVATGNRRLPGFLPDDAAEIRAVLPGILGNLKKDGLIRDPQIVMLGYSMGALETLKISELEEKDNTLNIKRYLAINPPVELSNAIDRADALAQTGSGWSSAEAIDQLSDVAGKGLSVLSRTAPPYDPAAGGEPGFDYRLPVSQEQAEYVAALYFKTCLRHLLLLAHKERTLPQFQNEYRWGKRNALYHEIDKIGFREYAEEFLAPEYPDIPLAELYRQSGMRSFAESLKRNPEVRVIQSFDDFLLTEEDRKWLDATFGKRLTWFDHGAHLGNLYTLPVQQQIIADLELPAE